MLRSSTVLWAGALATLLLPACNPSLDATRDGARILEERCAGCHTTEQILIHKKSPQEWEKSVDRMIRFGAQVEWGEKRVLIEYLSQKSHP